MVVVMILASARQSDIDQNQSACGKR